MDMFGAGQVIGSMIDFGSSAYQVDKQADMADHAMDFNRDTMWAQQNFTRDMSNTAYQRATADMKAAGLNPMLAYSQGGASTPPGGAPAGGMMGAAAKPDIRFMQSAAQAAQIENLEAQTRRTDAETENIRAEQIGERNDVGHILKLPRTWAAELKKAQGEAAWQEAGVAIRRAELTIEQRDHVKQLIQRAITENELARLDLPKAINEAAAEDTSFKRYVSPFLNDAGKIYNSAEGIAKFRQRGRFNDYIIHGK